MTVPRLRGRRAGRRGAGRQGARRAAELPPAPIGLKFLAGLVAVLWLGLAWWLLDLIAPGWPTQHVDRWLLPAIDIAWALVVLFVAHRYRVDLRARSTSADRRRALGWIFGYTLTPIVVLVLLVALVLFLPAWSVAHGGGTAGSLTLVRQGCAGCTWSGTFVADDNSVAYSDVTMVDPVRDRTVGGKVRVRLDDDGFAYAETGSTAWVRSGTVMLICGLYTLGALIWLARRIVRRRGLTPT